MYGVQEVFGDLEEDFEMKDLEDNHYGRQYAGIEVDMSVEETLRGPIILVLGSGILVPFFEGKGRFRCFIRPIFLMQRCDRHTGRFGTGLERRI